MARTAYRINELEKEHGDLHALIPEMVNKHGVTKTAAALSISAATISRWLKTNGYKQITTYIREPVKES